MRLSADAPAIEMNDRSRDHRRKSSTGLVDRLIHVVHRIGVRAERKVVNALLHDLRTVHGETTLLFWIGRVAVNHPDGVWVGGTKAATADAEA